MYKSVFIKENETPARKLAEYLHLVSKIETNKKIIEDKMFLFAHLFSSPIKSWGQK